MKKELIHEELSGKIIGAAMEVLNELKPGLDEKLYERALVLELQRRGHAVDVQRRFPLLDQFSKVIVDQGGSDLHIGEGQPPEMRKHGDIAPIRETPLTHDETMSMLSEVCGERNWKILEDRGDLDFAYEMDAASRFRC